MSTQCQPLIVLPSPVRVSLVLVTLATLWGSACGEPLDEAPMALRPPSRPPPTVEELALTQPPLEPFIFDGSVVQVGRNRRGFTLTYQSGISRTFAEASMPPALVARMQDAKTREMQTESELLERARAADFKVAMSSHDGALKTMSARDGRTVLVSHGTRGSLVSVDTLGHDERKELFAKLREWYYGEGAEEEVHEALEPLSRATALIDVNGDEVGVSYNMETRMFTLHFLHPAWRWEGKCSEVGSDVLASIFVQLGRRDLIPVLGSGQMFSTSTSTQVATFTASATAAMTVAAKPEASASTQSHTTERPSNSAGSDADRTGGRTDVSMHTMEAVLMVGSSEVTPDLPTVLGSLTPKAHLASAGSTLGPKEVAAIAAASEGKVKSRATFDDTDEESFATVAFVPYPHVLVPSSSPVLKTKWIQSSPLVGRPFTAFELAVQLMQPRGSFARLDSAPKAARNEDPMTTLQAIAHTIQADPASSIPKTRTELIDLVKWWARETVRRSGAVPINEYSPVSPKDDEIQQKRVREAALQFAMRHGIHSTRSGPNSMDDRLSLVAGPLGRTAVAVACRHHGREALQFVLRSSVGEATVRDGLRDLNGDTALHVCSKYAPTGHVKLVLESTPARLLAVPNLHGEIPLSTACRYASAESAAAILDKMVKDFSPALLRRALGVRAVDGETALHRCLVFQSSKVALAVAKPLEDHASALFGFVRKDDSSIYVHDPLVFACAYGDVDTVRGLARVYAGALGPDGVNMDEAIAACSIHNTELTTGAVRAASPTAKKSTVHVPQPVLRCIRGEAPDPGENPLRFVEASSPDRTLLERVLAGGTLMSKDTALSVCARMGEFKHHVQMIGALASSSVSSELVQKAIHGPYRSHDLQGSLSLIQLVVKFTRSRRERSEVLSSLLELMRTKSVKLSSQMAMGALAIGVTEGLTHEDIDSIVSLLGPSIAVTPLTALVDVMKRKRSAINNPVLAVAATGSRTRLVQMDSYLATITSRQTDDTPIGPTSMLNAIVKGMADGSDDLWDVVFDSETNSPRSRISFALDLMGRAELTTEFSSKVFASGLKQKGSILFNREDLVAEARAALRGDGKCSGAWEVASTFLCKKECDSSMIPMFNGEGSSVDAMQECVAPRGMHLNDDWCNCHVLDKPVEDTRASDARAHFPGARTTIAEAEKAFFDTLGVGAESAFATPLSGFGSIDVDFVTPCQINALAIGALVDQVNRLDKALLATFGVEQEAGPRFSILETRNDVVRLQSLLPGNAAKKSAEARNVLLAKHGRLAVLTGAGNHRSVLLSQAKSAHDSAATSTTSRLDFFKDMHPVHPFMPPLPGVERDEASRIDRGGEATQSRELLVAPGDPGIEGQLDAVQHTTVSRSDTVDTGARVAKDVTSERTTMIGSHARRRATMYDRMLEVTSPLEESARHLPKGDMLGSPTVRTSSKLVVTEIENRGNQRLGSSLVCTPPRLFRDVLSGMHLASQARRDQDPGSRPSTRWQYAETADGIVAADSDEVAGLWLIFKPGLLSDIAEGDGEPAEQDALSDTRDGGPSNHKRNGEDTASATSRTSEFSIEGDRLPISASPAHIERNAPATLITSIMRPEGEPVTVIKRDLVNDQLVHVQRQRDEDLFEAVVPESLLDSRLSFAAAQIDIVLNVDGKPFQVLNMGAWHLTSSLNRLASLATEMYGVDLRNEAKTMFTISANGKVSSVALSDTPLAQIVGSAKTVRIEVGIEGGGTADAPGHAFDVITGVEEGTAAPGPTRSARALLEAFAPADSSTAIRIINRVLSDISELGSGVLPPSLGGSCERWQLALTADEDLRNSYGCAEIGIGFRSFLDTGVRVQAIFQVARVERSLSSDTPSLDAGWSASLFKQLQLVAAIEAGTALRIIQDELDVPRESLARASDPIRLAAQLIAMKPDRTIVETPDAFVRALGDPALPAIYLMPKSFLPAAEAHVHEFQNSLRPRFKELTVLVPGGNDGGKPHHELVTLGMPSPGEWVFENQPVSIAEALYRSGPDSRVASSDKLLEADAFVSGYHQRLMGLAPNVCGGQKSRCAPVLRCTDTNSLVLTFGELRSCSELALSTLQYSSPRPTPVTRAWLFGVFKPALETARAAASSETGTSLGALIEEAAAVGVVPNSREDALIQVILLFPHAHEHRIEKADVVMRASELVGPSGSSTHGARPSLSPWLNKYLPILTGMASEHSIVFVSREKYVRDCSLVWSAGQQSAAVERVLIDTVDEADAGKPTRLVLWALEKAGAEASRASVGRKTACLAVWTRHTCGGEQFGCRGVGPWPVSMLGGTPPPRQGSTVFTPVHPWLTFAELRQEYLRQSGSAAENLAVPFVCLSRVTQEACTSESDGILTSASRLCCAVVATFGDNAWSRRAVAIMQRDSTRVTLRLSTARARLSISAMPVSHDGSEVTESFSLSLADGMSGEDVADAAGWLLGGRLLPRLLSKSPLPKQHAAELLSVSSLRVVGSDPSALLDVSSKEKPPLGSASTPLMLKAVESLERSQRHEEDLLEKLKITGMRDSHVWYEQSEFTWVRAIRLPTLASVMGTGPVAEHATLGLYQSGFRRGSCVGHGAVHSVGDHVLISTRDASEIVGVVKRMTASGESYVVATGIGDVVVSPVAFHGGMQSVPDRLIRRVYWEGDIVLVLSEPDHDRHFDVARVESCEERAKPVASGACRIRRSILNVADPSEDLLKGAEMVRTDRIFPVLRDADQSRTRNGKEHPLSGALREGLPIIARPWRTRRAASTFATGPLWEGNPSGDYPDAMEAQWAYGIIRRTQTGLVVSVEHGGISEGGSEFWRASLNVKPSARATDNWPLDKRASEMCLQPLDVDAYAEWVPDAQASSESWKTASTSSLQYSLAFRLKSRPVSARGNVMIAGHPRKRTVLSFAMPPMQIVTTSAETGLICTSNDVLEQTVSPYLSSRKLNVDSTSFHALLLQDYGATFCSLSRVKHVTVAGLSGTKHYKLRRNTRNQPVYTQVDSKMSLLQIREERRKAKQSRALARRNGVRRLLALKSRRPVSEVEVHLKTQNVTKWFGVSDKTIEIIGSVPLELLETGAPHPEMPSDPENFFPPEKPMLGTSTGYPANGQKYAKTGWDSFHLYFGYGSQFKATHYGNSDYGHGAEMHAGAGLSVCGFKLLRLFDFQFGLEMDPFRRYHTYSSVFLGFVPVQYTVAGNEEMPPKYLSGHFESLNLLEANYARLIVEDNMRWLGFPIRVPTPPKPEEIARALSYASSYIGTRMDTAQSMSIGQASTTLERGKPIQKCGGATGMHVKASKQSNRGAPLYSTTRLQYGRGMATIGTSSTGVGDVIEKTAFGEISQKASEAWAKALNTDKAKVPGALKILAFDVPFGGPIPFFAEFVASIDVNVEAFASGCTSKLGTTMSVGEHGPLLEPKITLWLSAGVSFGIPQADFLRVGVRGRVEAFSIGSSYGHMVRLTADIFNKNVPVTVQGCSVESTSASTLKGSLEMFAFGFTVTLFQMGSAFTWGAEKKDCKRTFSRLPRGQRVVSCCRPSAGVFSSSSFALREEFSEREATRFLAALDEHSVEDELASENPNSNVRLARADKNCDKGIEALQDVMGRLLPGHRRDPAYAAPLLTPPAVKLVNVVQSRFESLDAFERSVQIAIQIPAALRNAIKKGATEVHVDISISTESPWEVNEMVKQGRVRITRTITRRKGSRAVFQYWNILGDSDAESSRPLAFTLAVAHNWHKFRSNRREDAGTRVRISARFRFGDQIRHSHLRECPELRAVWPYLDFSYGTLREEEDRYTVLSDWSPPLAIDVPALIAEKDTRTRDDLPSYDEVIDHYKDDFDQKILIPFPGTAYVNIAERVSSFDRDNDEFTRRMIQQDVHHILIAEKSYPGGLIYPDNWEEIAARFPPRIMQWSDMKLAYRRFEK